MPNLRIWTVQTLNSDGTTSDIFLFQNKQDVIKSIHIAHANCMQNITITEGLTTVIAYNTAQKYCTVLATLQPLLLRAEHL